MWILLKIPLTFVPKGPIHTIPALVQIMAWRRPDDKPLFEPMLFFFIPTHICVTRPQWVNRYLHASPGLNVRKQKKTPQKNPQIITCLFSVGNLSGHRALLSIVRLISIISVNGYIHASPALNVWKQQNDVSRKSWSHHCLFSVKNLSDHGALSANLTNHHYCPWRSSK